MGPAGVDQQHIRQAGEDVAHTHQLSLRSSGTVHGPELQEERAEFCLRGSIESSSFAAGTTETSQFIDPTIDNA